MGFLDRLKGSRDEAKPSAIPATTPITPQAEDGASTPAPSTTDAVSPGLNAPEGASSDVASPDVTSPEVIPPVDFGFDSDISSLSAGIEEWAAQSTAPVAEKAAEPEAAVTEPAGAPVPTLVDFANEFGEAPPVVESPSSKAPAVIPVMDEAELEEWSEPLPSAAPAVLASATILETEEGSLEIENWLEERGGENIYLAGTADEATGLKTPVRLREATGPAGERLSREAMWRTHWDANGRIAMLPRLISGFKNGETSYLATEMPTEGPSLAQFIAAEESAALERKVGSDVEPSPETAAFLAEILLIATQLAAFLTKLHAAGFAHLGLRLDGIVLGKPVQVLDCSFAAPLGEALEAPLSFAGYSAPELSRPGVVDARSDLYAIGALLYRAVTGSDVPESGADFTTWQPRIVMAGVPQILRRTLGEVDTRFNSAEELHKALVKLKNRLRPSLSHTLSGQTTIGLESSRSTNQDAFGFQSGAWETDQGPVTWSAFCVADGMGGMAAGEIASEAAVNAFLRAASQWSAESTRLNAAPITAAAQAQLVKDWGALANEAVVKEMEARHARGGCTLDAGLVIDRRLCIAHVGDARFYLLRGEKFEVLSRDHSYVMTLLLQGQITFDDIRTHGERNKITRSLGERHPQPDYFIDSLQVQQGTPSMELQPGDVLMACSDGLWEPVLESEMLAAVAKGDLRRAGAEMLRLALQRGAPDNATLVLFRLDEDPAPVFA